MLDVQTVDLRLFAACVSEGSLSAAAKALGLTQAVATRRIQRLEGALGESVLHRTTRALRPTAAGERLLGASRVVLAELAELERSTGAARGAVGDVRVSAPLLLGQAIGASLASALSHEHPSLRLCLSLSNARVDLVREGVDVAIRVGSLPSSSLRAAKIATAHVGAYGRSDGHVRATHPSELAADRWIGLPSESRLEAHGPEGRRWSGDVALRFTCDDRLVLRRCAVSGMGNVLLPTFFGDEEAGLRRLVPAWHFGKVPLHVVWLPEADGDPRVRAVVESIRAWGRKASW